MDPRLGLLEGRKLHRRDRVHRALQELGVVEALWWKGRGRSEPARAAAASPSRNRPSPMRRRTRGASRCPALGVSDRRVGRGTIRRGVASGATAAFARCAPDNRLTPGGAHRSGAGPRLTEMAAGAGSAPAAPDLSVHTHEGGGRQAVPVTVRVARTLVVARRRRRLRLTAGERQRGGESEGRRERRAMLRHDDASLARGTAGASSDARCRSVDYCASLNRRNSAGQSTSP